MSHILTGDMPALAERSSDSTETSSAPQQFRLNMATAMPEQLSYTSRHRKRKMRVRVNGGWANLSPLLLWQSLAQLLFKFPLPQGFKTASSLLTATFEQDSKRTKTEDCNAKALKDLREGAVLPHFCPPECGRDTPLHIPPPVDALLLSDNSHSAHECRSHWHIEEGRGPKNVRWFFLVLQKTDFITRTWLRYVRVFAVAIPSDCLSVVCL